MTLYGIEISYYYGVVTGRNKIVLRKLYPSKKAAEADLDEQKKRIVEVIKEKDIYSVDERCPVEARVLDFEYDPS